MAKQNIEIVCDKIYWSYANLAMAHMAVKKKQDRYSRLNFMIRAKLFKGLKNGTMNMRTIFDDEKIKLETGQICNYCGSNSNLSMDHIFPKKYGGTDNADNLVYACKSCNSSKGKKDLMEWMKDKDHFLPLMIIRRYLKLVHNYCVVNSLMNMKMEELSNMGLPFRIELLPTSFPLPSTLVLSSRK
ncbi:MAG: HNH endonuclease [Candidatus Cloacimonetes bacterium]|nr:HNH endonuclease [Candidatus Cloacimonadota bacterium]